MDDKIYASAIRMLTGREHSCFELVEKLKKKGHGSDDIDDVVAQLLKDKYLNDARFAEMFIRSKSKRGIGPIKIQMELQQRSVDSSLIDEYLDFNQPDWFESAIEVRCKRFGEVLPDDVNEKAKQIRFLQQRGFTQKQIMSVITSNVFDD